MLKNYYRGQNKNVIKYKSISKIYIFFQITIVALDSYLWL